MDFLSNPLAALGSIAGIVALTIAIVHILKRQLADVPYLNQVPVLIYALLVSAGLTYAAHAYVHSIEGELPSLMVQAVLQTVLASGVIEQFRSGAKPLADTAVAQRASDRKRFGRR